MREFSGLEMNPKTDIITNYPNTLPYGLEEFKIDLDWEQRKETEMKENFHPVSLQERRHFENINKHILTKRF
jgi:hypothetical protein